MSMPIGQRGLQRLAAGLAALSPSRR
jgi:hypothetical protein